MSSDLPALLLVFTEPGAVPEAEFHDWYDNEHIDLRMKVPGILTATRYHQADSTKPSWAASYDLTNLGVLQSDAYKALFTNRSARETNVLANLDVLDRRIYVLNDTAPLRAAPGFDATKPTPVAVMVSIDVPEGQEEDFHRWYDEEHVPLLMKVPGWQRTRRFTLIESGISGAGAEAYKDKAQAPKFLALHDFTSEEGLGGEEMQAARNTPWRTKVMGYATAQERRVFAVHKFFQPQKQ